jgi:hypothetical protein
VSRSPFPVEEGGLHQRSRSFCKLAIAQSFGLAGRLLKEAVQPSKRPRIGIRRVRVHIFADRDSVGGMA